jgi:hypothetical protein
MNKNVNSVPPPSLMDQLKKLENIELGVFEWSYSLRKRDLIFFFFLLSFFTGSLGLEGIEYLVTILYVLTTVYDFYFFFYYLKDKRVINKEPNYKMKGFLLHLILYSIPFVVFHLALVSESIYRFGGFDCLFQGGLCVSKVIIKMNDSHRCCFSAVYPPLSTFLLLIKYVQNTLRRGCVLSKIGSGVIPGGECDLNFADQFNDAVNNFPVLYMFTIAFISVYAIVWYINRPLRKFRSTETIGSLINETLKLCEDKKVMSLGEFIHKTNKSYDLSRINFVPVDIAKFCGTKLSYFDILLMIKEYYDVSSNITHDQIVFLAVRIYLYNLLGEDVVKIEPVIKEALGGNDYFKIKKYAASVKKRLFRIKEVKGKSKRGRGYRKNIARRARRTQAKYNAEWSYAKDLAEGFMAGNVSQATIERYAVDLGFLGWNQFMDYAENRLIVEYDNEAYNDDGTYLWYHDDEDYEFDDNDKIRNVDDYTRGMYDDYQIDEYDDSKFDRPVSENYKKIDLLLGGDWTPGSAWTDNETIEFVMDESYGRKKESSLSDNYFDSLLGEPVKRRKESTSFWVNPNDQKFKDYVKQVLFPKVLKNSVPRVFASIDKFKYLDKYPVNDERVYLPYFVQVFAEHLKELKYPVVIQADFSELTEEFRALHPLTRIPYDPKPEEDEVVYQELSHSPRIPKKKNNDRKTNG